MLSQDSVFYVVVKDPVLYREEWTQMSLGDLLANPKNVKPSHVEMVALQVLDQVNETDKEGVISVDFEQLRELALRALARARSFESLNASGHA